MFRQKHNLAALYRSLAAQKEKRFRIYFVDNNPDENDADHSKELNSGLGLDIVYIKTGNNTGFAGGNNIGAVKALAEGCKYIFFLNNDTVLDEFCLLHLLGAAESHPGTGAAAPFILYGIPGKEKNIIQEFGAEADFRNYYIRKNFGALEYEKIKDSLPEILETDLVSGGAAFLGSDALRKAGLWEEKYFAYGDEIDLAKRIKQAGYKTIAVKNAVLWHNHMWNKENKEGYYFEYYLIQRNKYLYFRKFKLYGRMFISFIVDMIKFPWRLLWFVRVCGPSLGLYYLRGTFAGIIGKTGKPNLSFLK